MKTRKINLRGKIIEAVECRNLFSKARGLMFRENSKPLILKFKKPTRQAIHSFFCKPFKAVWLKDGKIIDEKIVKPFSLSVKPKKYFTEIVEIPLKNSPKNFNLPTKNRKI